MFDVGEFIDYDYDKSQDFPLSLLYAFANLFFGIGAVLLFIFPNPLHIPIPILSHSLLVAAYIAGLVVIYFRTAFIAAKMKNRGFMLWATIFWPGFYLTNLLINFSIYFIIALVHSCVFLWEAHSAFPDKVSKISWPKRKVKEIESGLVPESGAYRTPPKNCETCGHQL